MDITHQFHVIIPDTKGENRELLSKLLFIQCFSSCSTKLKFFLPCNCHVWIFMRDQTDGVLLRLLIFLNPFMAYDHNMDHFFWDCFCTGRTGSWKTGFKFYRFITLNKGHLHMHCLCKQAVIQAYSVEKQGCEEIVLKNLLSIYLLIQPWNGKLLFYYCLPLRRINSSQYLPVRIWALFFAIVVLHLIFYHNIVHVIMRSCFFLCFHPVLSKVKVRLWDTTFRVEHVPKHSSTGVAFEIRMEK